MGFWPVSHSESNSLFNTLSAIHYVRHAQIALRWRHNGRDSVSNHQHQDCLLNRLFRRRSKKTSKLRVTGFVLGIHRWPVNSPHKGPVTRKMFPFNDVIMDMLKKADSTKNWFVTKTIRRPLRGSYHLLKNAFASNVYILNNTRPFEQIC